MFIAHLPAGYLATRLYLRVAPSVTPGAWKFYALFGLLCSVLPDFDLAYFYLIDHRQHAHHSYWTHIPLFWLLFTALIYAGARAFSKKNLGPACAVLLLNTQLHLLLDSVAGGIYWLYPFHGEYYRLFKITPQFGWWVWNFILHWTFLFELSIVAAAAYIFWQGRKTASLVLPSSQSG